MREAGPRGVARRRPATSSAAAATRASGAGSHLDSVPTGGRFDGALGVVAAIEAADAAARGAARRRRVPRGGDRARWAASASSELPDAFLELHIEQGPVLAQLGEPLGIVTAIAGQARGSGRLRGPRRPRRDDADGRARRRARRGGARSSCTCATARAAGTVATVGAIEVEPNATNVVPAQATVSVDARAADAAQLDALIAEIGFEPTGAPTRCR